MYHSFMTNAKQIQLGKGPLADVAAASLAPMFAALSDPLAFASLIWFVEPGTTASVHVISLNRLIEANPQLATT